MKYQSETKFGWNWLHNMFLSTQTPSEITICHFRQLAKVADKKGAYKEIKFDTILHPYSEQIKDIGPNISLLHFEYQNHKVQRTWPFQAKYKIMYVVVPC